MEENCGPRDRNRSKGFFAALCVSFIKAREDWFELSKNRASLFVCPRRVRHDFQGQLHSIGNFNSEKRYPFPPPQLHTCSYYYQGGLWKFLESNEVDKRILRILETLITRRSKWPNMTDSPKRVLEYYWKNHHRIAKLIKWAIILFNLTLSFNLTYQ